jgi:BirA family transcriptional regulator, biotin operon repressor / biotin---[acetyl-CoA-carboxylase] ligase
MKALTISSPWPGAPVYFKKRTTSTMEDARRLFASGCPDFQTRGRGRFAERSWSAEAGKNLLFTLVLRSEGGSYGLGTAPQRLPLLAGLAAAQCVERMYGLAVQLKWPNDLLVERKKLAGILCEALVEGNSLGFLAGLGLNCNQRSFPEELESGATSLARVLGRRVNRADLLRELLQKLKESLADEDWRQKVVDRLYGLGATAEWLSGVGGFPQPGSERIGRVLGVNPDGSLLFQPENAQPRSVYAGEIRFIDALQ